MIVNRAGDTSAMPRTPDPADDRRFDAIRAVTHRAKADGWTLAQARQALEVLGLVAPPGEVLPPCPTCGAARGAPCRTSGSRRRFCGTHGARQGAA